MDELFNDLDLYFGPQAIQKSRGTAEGSTAALIASSMSNDYNEDWSHRQHQAQTHMAPSNHLGPDSYRPNYVMNNSLASCSVDSNRVGSFDLPGELSLPPMSAPTDNINFISQYSDIINYPNLEPFSVDGNQQRNNGDITYGNNGANNAYEDNRVLGASSGPNPYHDSRALGSTGSQLLRIDGNTDGSFLSAKKDYLEETPYYTDLDIIKPADVPPKNSDGNFLSPSIELNNTVAQYSPGAPSPAVNFVEDVSPKKKVKSPRKMPSKKRKATDNENSMMSPSHSIDNDTLSIKSDYSNASNFGDGNINFPSSSNDSNNTPFPQYPMKPEASTLIRGKVKQPKKTPTKKKKVPVSYSASVDTPSLKIKLKCEKSIGTENEEWSVSGDANDRVTQLPTAQTNTHTVNQSSDQVALNSPNSSQPSSAVPESISRVNEKESDSTSNRGVTPYKSQPRAPSEIEVFKVPCIVPHKETKPMSTSKTKCPTAKAPSYLTGFPMRCPEYPIVYCCNHCARIFTSIRGGQLHECVIKRRGRKAGMKSQ